MREFWQWISWRPGVGDPTFIGWLTVLAYLVAAGLCLACAWRAPRIFADHHRQHRLVWGGLAAGLLLLALNKQLDLQTLVTEVGRAVAYQQGWYDWRQPVQILIVGLLGLAALAAFLLLAWQVRHVWRQYWLLLLGLLFIGRFVLVRAAAIWGIPLPQLSRLTGGVRLNWLLELAGAAVIMLAAALNLRRGRPRPGRTTT